MFKKGDQVVYAAHGAGMVKDITNEEIAGSLVEFYLVELFEGGMLVRVPVCGGSGRLRRVNDAAIVPNIVTVMRCSVRVSKVIWSKRYSEYETKVSSGDLLAIAEVVRDLFSNVSDANCSYSEREIYNRAMWRLSQELSLVIGVGEDVMRKQIADLLSGMTDGLGAKYLEAEGVDA